MAAAAQLICGLLPALEAGGSRQRWQYCNKRRTLQNCKLLRENEREEGFVLGWKFLNSVNGVYALETRSCNFPHFPFESLCGKILVAETFHFES